MYKLSKKQLNDIKEYTKRPKFYYQFLDCQRQELEYRIKQLKDKESANEKFPYVEAMLLAVKESDRPEWYTMADLERDRLAIERL